MARVLNFSAVLHDDVEVYVDGVLRWRLRDDVPTAILLRGFEAFNLMQQMQEAEVDSDDYFAAAAAFDEAVLRVVAGIFRFSYPDMTLDEVAEQTSAMQRMQVFNAFFTTRSGASGAPSSATASSSAQSQTPALTPAPAASPSATSQAVTSKRKH